MPRTGFTLNPRDLKKLEHALDPRVMKAAIKRHVRQASIKNGKIAEAVIRQAIRNGAFDINAPLTEDIKGSTKPLVDRGTGLFQAITSKVIDDTQVFAGVLRTEGMYNIAILLHEGGTIRVTPAMRGMFFFLWKASEGEMDSAKLTGRAAELWERKSGGWLPISTGTSHIIIPRRPFIAEAFRDTRLRTRVKANWSDAVQAALRELARGSG